MDEYEINDYERGYKNGLKEGRSERNFMLMQIGLTALVTFGLTFVGNLERSIIKDGQKSCIEYKIPYTPELFDENEPHKYNPNSSSVPLN